jgi:2-hydroxy-3-oxopropionate reductase
MSKKLALVGAGAMGGAIGTRFLEAGNDLAVFDLDAEKVAKLVEKGATAAASAAEAAQGAVATITSLNSSKIVGLAAFGKDGVADGADPGALIIDMSSMTPKQPRNSPRWPKSKAWPGSIVHCRGGHPRRCRVS